MASDDAQRKGDASDGSTQAESTLSGASGLVFRDTLVGTKLADRYQIISVIGHGGMGVVYKARHELMDRIVAIKMLKPQLIMDAQSAQRFQQEAKAASRLSHPNVITLFDFGMTATGQPYLVMDYLPGTSLADLIKQEGRVGVERFLRICAQVCDALDHAHRHGIIHRDLKPGNIMLTVREGEPDFVKVVDFGVAKILPFAGEDSQSVTQSGEVFGSPVYMSPEQCVGEPLDVRSDVYSMGVVMYEMLTGRVPLRGKDIIQTIMMHKCDMPPRFSQVRPDLKLPERLETVVLNALQKDPAQRHQTMAELKEDLLLSAPGSARSRTVKIPVSPRDTTQALERADGANGRRGLLLAAVISLLVAVVGAAGWMIGHKPPHAAQRPAWPPTASPAAKAPAVQQAAGSPQPDGKRQRPGGTARRVPGQPSQAVSPAVPAQRPARVFTQQAPAARRKARTRAVAPPQATEAAEPVTAEPATGSQPDAMGTWYKFTENEKSR
ncbi:MAG TPA: protein kinase [Candidatus Obscuribacterales bacterium]